MIQKTFTLLREKLYGVFVAGVLLVIGSLVGELKEVYSTIILPFVSMANLLESYQDANNFIKLLFSAICIMIYLAVVSYIPLLIAKDRKQIEKSSPAPEIMLYTEEISAAMEVIEKPGVQEIEITNTVDHLMRRIGMQAMSIFPGLDHRFVRASFLVTNLEGNIMVVSLGRHFGLTELDMKMVDEILGMPDNPYLKGNVRELFPANDMEAIGFIRNQGPNFRFGYVIMLPSKEMITMETEAHFKAAAVAVQHIVYMDKLWKLMVSYSQNLDGGGSDGSSRSRA
ncbi:hypothetical protein [Brevibacillus centrosporus]|jgi:hypothetical protein|uniref:hypothetical protein n=1 Tax=Brevibacillus centrosporus TaxID=54910 RepID=UPI00398574DB